MFEQQNLSTSYHMSLNNQWNAHKLCNEQAKLRVSTSANLSSITGSVNKPGRRQPSTSATSVNWPPLISSQQEPGQWLCNESSK